MRVLIIEDEAKTASYLSKGLLEQGYVADVASNGRDGLHLAMSDSYAHCETNNRECTFTPLGYQSAIAACV